MSMNVDLSFVTIHQNTECIFIGKSLLPLEAAVTKLGNFNKSSNRPWCSFDFYCIFLIDRSRFVANVLHKTSVYNFSHRCHC